MLAFLLLLCTSPVVAWSHRRRELLETQYNSRGGILITNYSATPNVRAVSIDTLPLLAMECDQNSMSMRLSADVSPKEEHEDDPFVFGKSRLLKGMILVSNGGCGHESRPFYRHITSITSKSLDARSILYTMETEDVPLWHMFAHADIGVTYLPLSHPDHPGVSALPSHIRRLVDDDYVETENERALLEVGDYEPFVNMDFDSGLFGAGWNHELGAGAVAKDPKLLVFRAPEFFTLSCVECFAFVEVRMTFRLIAALRSVSFNGGWWNLIPFVALWNAATWVVERVANLVPRLDLFEITMHGEAQLKIILEAELQRDWNADPFYTYPIVGLPDLVFSVGPIPVYIATNLSVTVGAKLHVAEGSKAYAGFGAQAALDVGYRAFTAGNGALVSSKWFKPALTMGLYGPGFQTPKASITPYLRFTITFTLYSVAPVSFSIIPSITFQIEQGACDIGNTAPSTVTGTHLLTQRFKLAAEIIIEQLTFGISAWGPQWTIRFGSPLLPQKFEIPLVGEIDIVPPKCISLAEYPSDFQTIEYSVSWSWQGGVEDGPYTYLGYGLCIPLGVRVFDGTGDNEGTMQEKTDKCAAACLLKEEGTEKAYGPWSERPEVIGFGLNEVSGRCYCQHEEWAPCTKKYSSYKVFKYTEFSEAPSYIHYPRSCVFGNNIKLYANQDLDLCAQRCDSEEDCVGFEYGVDYGQDNYKARDCILQSSTNRAADCSDYNLDFYEKVSGTQPEDYPTECTREIGIDQRRGSGWRRIEAPRAVTDIECARACNKNDECLAWINAHYSNSCWLSRTVPDKFRAAERRSYGTRCPSLGSRMGRQSVSVPTNCSECNAGLGSDRFWCASAPGAETGNCLSVGADNIASCPSENIMMETCDYVPPVEVMRVVSFSETPLRDLILTSIRWSGGPTDRKITVFTTDVTKGGLYSDFFGIQMLNENDGKADIVVYQDILEEDANGVLRRPPIKQLMIVVASAETSGELQVTARRPPNITAAFWRAAPWTLCTKPCGGGVTTRDMDCYQAVDPTDPDSAYAQVPDDLCPPPFIAEYPCNLNACEGSDLVVQVQPDEEDFSTNPVRTVRSLGGESMMLYVVGGQPGSGYKVEYAWMGETFPFDNNRETAVWSPVYEYEMSQGTNLSRVINIEIPFSLKAGFYEARVGLTGGEEIEDFIYGDRMTYVPADTGCQLRCGPGLQYIDGQCTMNDGSACCISTEAACGEGPESSSDTVRCVCAFDLFCCQNSWDAQCKEEAITECNLVC